MKIINKTLNNLSHMENEKLYFIGAGEHKEVPDKIAKLWLKLKGVEEYVSPEDLKAAEDKAKAEKKALEAENAKLKKQLETKKTTKAKK